MSVVGPDTWFLISAPASVVDGDYRYLVAFNRNVPLPSLADNIIVLVDIEADDGRYALLSDEYGNYKVSSSSTPSRAEIEAVNPWLNVDGEFHLLDESTDSYGDVPERKPVARLVLNYSLSLEGQLSSFVGMRVPDSNDLGAGNIKNILASLPVDSYVSICVNGIIGVLKVVDKTGPFPECEYASLSPCGDGDNNTWFFDYNLVEDEDTSVVNANLRSLSCQIGVSPSTVWDEFIGRDTGSVRGFTLLDNGEGSEISAPSVIPAPFVFYEI